MTDHDLGSGARETGTEDAGDERADDGHVGDEGTVPTVPAARSNAGAALFNEGYVLAAHDPWEAAWLPLAEGPDERLLHGLIAAAAATHHAGARNWSGRSAAARERGRVPRRCRIDAAGVDIEPVRDWCRRLATDPETIERTAPPTLRIEGTALRFGDLDLPAALLAAPALAGAVTHGDEATFETAAELAREEERDRSDAVCGATVRVPPRARHPPTGGRAVRGSRGTRTAKAAGCRRPVLNGVLPVRRRRSACRGLTESWVRSGRRRD